jgi:hypothetical protein
VAASDSSGQPLTRDACGQAGMDWNDRANVCESESDELNIGVVKPHTPGVSQPLSRSACDEASLEWNDSANVCGASAATAQTASEVKAAETSGQPLTRDDCSKAGMTWNDSTNVCGETSEGSKVQAAPLSPKQQSAKKVEVERSKVKAAKKVERAKPKAAPKAAKAKSSKKQAYTKTGSAYRRKAQAQPAPPVQRRPFRLFRNRDRPVTVQ